MTSPSFYVEIGIKKANKDLPAHLGNAFCTPIPRYASPPIHCKSRMFSIVGQAGDETEY